MTLVLGLRCRDGVVLASDSQRTDGDVRESVRKLFVSPAGIIWGTAGSIATQQEMYTEMSRLDVERWPAREAGRHAIVQALKTAIRTTAAQLDDPSPAATTAGGIFAWYSRSEERTYLLRVQHSGAAEFRPKYTAVGPGTPQSLALFALSRSEHLEYASLPLEAAAMVAFSAADDVVRGSAAGRVGGSIQIAVVSDADARFLSPVEVRALEDTLGAFRTHQRDYLVRDDDTGPEPDTGVRP
jgi:20S proteasome alpha/beta subunit